MVRGRCLFFFIFPLSSLDSSLLRSEGLESDNGDYLP
jgi:hypothetical protein